MNNWIIFGIFIIINILLLFLQKIIKNTSEGYIFTLILMLIQFVSLYTNTFLNFHNFNIPDTIQKNIFSLIALIILIYHLLERNKIYKK